MNLTRPTPPKIEFIQHIRTLIDSSLLSNTSHFISSHFISSHIRDCTYKRTSQIKILELGYHKFQIEKNERDLSDFRNG